jgi:L-threonylcarbamoyladenylate synthase
MLPRHYAPRTPLYCEDGPERARLRAEIMATQGFRVGWIPFTATLDWGMTSVVGVDLPKHPTRYASRLYEALHELDQAGLSAIVVEMPPATEEWLAVRDRLKRAAIAEESRSPPPKRNRKKK